LNRQNGGESLFTAAVSHLHFQMVKLPKLHSNKKSIYGQSTIVDWPCSFMKIRLDQPGSVAAITLLDAQS